MRFSPLLALPFIAIACSFSVNAEEANDPTLLGQLFCDLRENEFALTYLLTPSLTAEVENANARSKAIQAVNPDEKPPLGDGIPYKSYQDYAPVCRPGQIVAVDGADFIEVEYVFPDAPDGNWTDRLALKEENGRLLIDDVVYGATFQGSLRKVLVEAFENQ